MSTMPVITFHGPGSDNQIVAVNTTGQEVARFIAEGSKKHFTISRIASPNASPMVICTGTKSSWSEETKLDVHGAQLKYVMDSFMGVEAHIKLPAPIGKLKWSEDGSLLSASMFKLVDGSKTVVARASTKEMRCDVFVTGDERLFDYILSSWIPLLLYHKSSVLDRGSGGQSYGQSYGQSNGGNNGGKDKKSSELKEILAVAKIFSALNGGDS